MSLLSFALLSTAFVSNAEAALKIKVHKVGDLARGAGQYLEVFENDQYLHSFWVSTGNPRKTVRAHTRGNEIQGIETRSGIYFVQQMKPRLVSNQSASKEELPYWIFFDGAVAIHGTRNTERLGKKNSLGCVNASEDDAAWLYALVSETLQREGRRAVKIEVLSKKVPGRAPLDAPPFAQNQCAQNCGKPSSIRPAERGATDILTVVRTPLASR